MEQAVSLQTPHLPLLLLLKACRGGPPLLLLPGFGVGTFHFQHQLRELSRDRSVWAMDFMGQGQSWPSHDPAPLPVEARKAGEESLSEDINPWDWGFGPKAESWADGLVYSVDMWREQVVGFITNVRIFGCYTQTLNNISAQ